MNGGEPLSEELSPEVELLIEQAVEFFNGKGPILFTADGERRITKREYLRAFAREIQEPLEKKRALDTPIIHAQAASIIHLRVRLLATEESESALRHKLTSLESVDKQLTDAREASRKYVAMTDPLITCGFHDADAGTPGTPCGDCRRCLWESARSLAEALEHVYVLTGNADVRRIARNGLAAYRESGRGKP